MKKVKTLGGILLALAVSAVQAAPVLLDTLEHDYGTGTGQVAPSSMGAGSCDVMGTNSVTVRSASGCQRFYDEFDFGGLSYDSIDRFEFTLGYSGARNELVFPFVGSLERWAPRPASSTSNGSAQTAAYLGSSGVQTWVFDSSLDIFGDILASESFFAWMSREGGWGTLSVDLDFAKLEIYGSPETNAVPTPGTLALALFGLVAGGATTSQVRRARRT
jgi:hypothetical protein